MRGISAAPQSRPWYARRDGIAHSARREGLEFTMHTSANAVWHATGIRVRHFPITLDRIII